MSNICVACAQYGCTAFQQDHITIHVIIYIVKIYLKAALPYGTPLMMTNASVACARSPRLFWSALSSPKLSLPASAALHLTYYIKWEGRSRVRACLVSVGMDGSLCIFDALKKCYCSFSHLKFYI